MRSYSMRELSSGWIPYRNLRVILACAEVAPDVVLARIAEWGPDKNPGFFRRTERLLASSRGGHFQGAADLPRVRIHTPFGHMTKTALVRRYLQLFGPTGADDLVNYTWSCYGPGPGFCGKCGGCWCRWVAFHHNGIDESDRYEQDPVRGDYYRRLDWRDFRPGMVPMYAKRAWEMRGLG
jgi:7-cyano-7-deazaguanine synthase in queuosine biosynthesis